MNMNTTTKKKNGYIYILYIYTRKYFNTLCCQTLHYLMKMYMRKHSGRVWHSRLLRCGYKQPSPPLRFQGLPGDWIVCHARAATQSRAAGGRFRNLVIAMRSRKHDEFILAMLRCWLVDKFRVVKRPGPVLFWTPQALLLLGAAKQQGTSATDS